MKLGVTGTRQGMTHVQQIQFGKYASSLLPLEEFHHGDCVGADEQAASIVSKLPGDHVVLGHPPTDEKHRAFFKSDGTYDAKAYLQRNRDIVQAVDLLIVCPKDRTRERRSGTWATCRYAEKNGKPVTIIYPDGKVKVKSGEEPF